MNYNYKINLTHLLGPNYKNYGAILVEKHPQVVHQKGHNGLPIESYLWYPIELGQIPNTFTEYFREKLAVTNPVEAKQIIQDWNTKHIPIAGIVKQFKVGRKRFVAINDPNNSDMLIVLANYSDRPAYTEAVHTGSGGYIWQRLSKNGPITHADLKSKFCLRTKSERERFLG